MVFRCETFRNDKGIVVLHSVKVSHLSIIPNSFYESPKLQNWMCELCTFSQIWSPIVSGSLLPEKSEHMPERPLSHVSISVLATNEKLVISYNLFILIQAEISFSC